MDKSTKNTFRRVKETMPHLNEAERLRKRAEITEKLLKIIEKYIIVYDVTEP